MPEELFSGGGEEYLGWYFTGAILSYDTRILFYIMPDNEDQVSILTEQFIPEVRKLHDAEADAFLDTQLTDDPMHNWLSRPTAELKADIRSGKMKEIYSELFQSAMPGTVPEGKEH